MKALTDKANDYVTRVLNSPGEVASAQWNALLARAKAEACDLAAELIRRWAADRVHPRVPNYRAGEKPAQERHFEVGEKTVECLGNLLEGVVQAPLQERQVLLAAAFGFVGPRGCERSIQPLRCRS